MKLLNKPAPVVGFLDRGTSITGDLQFSGVLRIDGNFSGSISGPDTLIVGEHAVIHADVQVGNLEIHGQVTGNVEVKGRTEIFSGAALRGDLCTASLVVQADAIFDGHSRMPTDTAGKETEVSTQGRPVQSANGLA